MLIPIKFSLLLLRFQSSKNIILSTKWITYPAFYNGNRKSTENFTTCAISMQEYFPYTVCSKSFSSLKHNPHAYRVIKFIWITVFFGDGSEDSLLMESRCYHLPASRSISRKLRSRAKTSKCVLFVLEVHTILLIYCVHFLVFVWHIDYAFAPMTKIMEFLVKIDGIKRIWRENKWKLRPIYIRSSLPGGLTQHK